MQSICLLQDCLWDVFGQVLADLPEHETTMKGLPDATFKEGTLHT
jgi:hypothetical protein